MVYFKYTQQSKVTGGALAGVTKCLAFSSKSAGKRMNLKTLTTMDSRQSHALPSNRPVKSKSSIDGWWIVHRLRKKTYSVVTFDQIKQQVEQAEVKAKEEQMNSFPRMTTSRARDPRSQVRHASHRSELALSS